eukprot:125527-Prymnesium_polylepis.2
MAPSRATSDTGQRDRPRTKPKRRIGGRVRRVCVELPSRCVDCEARLAQHGGRAEGFHALSHARARHDAREALTCKYTGATSRPAGVQVGVLASRPTPARGAHACPEAAVAEA